mmetsp:Transcript_33347/g.92166  ORF Transcript_33347/g.92166 Transcript_33347/m.92166 type:complete len:218 (+) Transcript_33347:586-1239(+)
MRRSLASSRTTVGSPRWSALDARICRRRTCSFKCWTRSRRARFGPRPWTPSAASTPPPSPRHCRASRTSSWAPTPPGAASAPLPRWPRTRRFRACWRTRRAGPSAQPSLRRAAGAWATASGSTRSCFSPSWMSVAQGALVPASCPCCPSLTARPSSADWLLADLSSRTPMGVPRWPSRPCSMTVASSSTRPRQQNHSSSGHGVALWPTAAGSGCSGS